MIKLRIRQWYDAFDGEVYVSFSGGKDSTVLLDIVRKTFKDIKGVFCDTGLEYPEIRNFVKSYSNIDWIKPEMNFRKVIQEYGYPVVSKETSQRIYMLRKYNLSERFKNKLLGKGIHSVPQKWRFLLDAPFDISHNCCNVMKKRPFHKYEKETGKKAILATMASESSLRRQSWMRYGCNAFDKGVSQSRPMSFWTENDVLEYLVKYDINYCSVYGDIVALFPDNKVLSPAETKEFVNSGKLTSNIKLKTTKCDRTGCMFCMYGCYRDASPNRFERMKDEHPNQYNFCMKPLENGGLGLAKVLDYISVKY